jgi:hypothetical protein
MKEKTYKNNYGETMQIKYERILTIEHEDIGTVYHIPIEGNIGMFFTPSEMKMPINDPETGEPMMMPILSPAILNAEELAIIVAHME